MKKSDRRWTRLGFETLEERALLSVSPSGIDAPIANATSVVVTTLDDEVVENDVISLREAISQVDTGGTITFDPDLVGGTITLNGTQLAIEKSLTIDATGLTGGITVNANQLSRVFSISGGTSAAPVTLKGLTITNGKTTESGGGIYINESSTVNLTNCTVSGNTATSNGGGICAGTSSTVTLTNCVVSGNTTGNNGGGIYVTSSYVALTNCEVSGNTAKSYCGGGIQISNSTATLINCTVSGNTAKTYGGGIRAYADSGKTTKVTRYNCIISQNKAGNSDNNYSTSGDVTTIKEGCRVTDDDVGFVVAPVFSGTTLTNRDTMNLHLKSTSSAIDYGDNTYVPADLLYDLDGHTRILNEKVDAGAYETETRSTVVTTLEDKDDACDGKISLREAITYAGVGSLGTTITFAESLSAGGTITLSGKQLGIQKSLTIDATDLTGGITVNANKLSRVFWIGNDVTAFQVTLRGLTITGGKNPTLSGGGIYVATCSVTLTNCTVSGNTTSGNGGGIYVNSSTVTLTNCTVSGNTTSSTGGGIHLDHSYLALTNCEVSGNTATSSGGGIYANYSNPNLTNCVVSGNTAGDNGGGIYFTASTLNLTNCEVSGNIAKNNGGGIQISNATATLINCTVAGNIAKEKGGGIRAFADTGKTNLTYYNCIISQNKAGESGNNYSSKGSSSSVNVTRYNYLVTDADVGFVVAPVFSGTTLTNRDTMNLHLKSTSSAIDCGKNTYVPADLLYDLAGHTRILNGTVDIGAYETETRSTVVTTLEDKDDACDGLISLREAITYAGVGSLGTTITFAESLSTGGTITLNGTQLAIGKSLTIDAMTGVTGKITIDADEKSRVFYIYGGTSAAPVTLNGLTITGGNAGDQHGGGVYAHGSSPVTLTNCNVSENTAIYGGGIYAYCSYPVTLTNCVVSGNTANYGGGIAAYSSTVTLTNCEVSGNMSPAYGGGIGAGTSSTVTLTNCTVSGNTANTGGGFYVSHSGAVTLTNCNVTGNKVTLYGGGIYAESPVTLTNCNVSGNTAGKSGGGFYVSYTNATLINCTVSGNTAGESGGGIYVAGDSGRQVKVTRNNCIISQNKAGSGDNNYVVNDETYVTTIEHNCLVTDDDVGFVVAPFFVDGELKNTPNYHLKPTSAAVDAGENSYIKDYETDLDGKERICNNTVDIGAYELQTETTSTIVTTEDDVINVYDGKISLREAISYAETGSLGTEITFNEKLAGKTITLSDEKAHKTLIIDKNLTINASALTGGIIVSGDNKNQIFAIGLETGNSLTVALKGLTLTKGSAARSGGAIGVRNATLTLSGAMAFTENHSTEGGGAIYIASDATVTTDAETTGVTFSGNYCGAGKNGGAINNCGTLTLTGATFTGNSAKEGKTTGFDWTTTTGSGGALVN